MGFPTFDSFSLQDSNYITSELEYRTIPVRALDSSKIARRAGVKLLSDDFAERRVTIRGYIIASSASDLQTKIDNLHTNITRKESGSLYIDSNRYAIATVSSLGIGDPHYAQDYVPFDIEFLLADPFFYSSPQNVNITLANGCSSVNVTTTISGSVYAEPSLTYTASAGAGLTTTSGINITYEATGEVITWSGTTSPALSHGDALIFDYGNNLITLNSISEDFEGVFSRWEPGSTNFLVTFSGTQTGGTLTMSYQPRYL